MLSTADDIKSNLVEIDNRFASLSSPDCEGVLVQTSVRGPGLLLGILGQDHEELLHPHEVSDHQDFVGQQTFCQDGRFVRKTFCQDRLRRFVRKTFCQDRLRRFVRTDLP